MVGVVIVNPALIVTENARLVVFEAESVTFAVKLAVPPALGVVPERTPLPDRLRPTALRLLAPAVTVQAYPPDPPVAASVC